MIMNTEPNPTPLICLECGAANPPDATLCTACRVPLQGGPPVELIPIKGPPVLIPLRSRARLLLPPTVLGVVAAVFLLGAWLSGQTAIEMVVEVTGVLGVMAALAYYATLRADAASPVTGGQWMRRFLLSLIIAFGVIAGGLLLIGAAVAICFFIICTASLNR